MSRSRCWSLGARVLFVSLALIGSASAPGEEPATSSELVSKRYEFKNDVNMALDVTTPSGLRLDTVRFKMPRAKADRLTRSAGLLSADVAVSNTTTASLKVGLGIALYDDEGRMLAVASGGNKLTPVKGQRQKTFTLLFDGVNAEAHKATTFQISLESKP